MSGDEMDIDERHEHISIRKMNERRHHMMGRHFRGMMGDEMEYMEMMHRMHDRDMDKDMISEGFNSEFHPEFPQKKIYYAEESDIAAKTSIIASKVEAEEAAINFLTSKQKKNDSKITYEGEFELFDPFGEEDKLATTTKDIDVDFDENSTTLIFCRRCEKDIKISCYHKHIVNHIYEKRFLIERWKLRYNESLCDPIQRFLVKNKKIFMKLNEAYFDKITSPKNAEDFEMVFYMIQSSLKTDGEYDIKKVEEAYQLLDAYTRILIV